MSTPSIVVGYDVSRESDLAIDWAIDHAQRVEGHLLVLHVGPSRPGQGVSPDGVFGWQADSALDESMVTLPGVGRAKAALGEDAVAVEFSTGSAPGRLVEASQTADLIVVGSHGHGYLLSGLIGSTAYAVIAHAHCPVAVIRAPRDAEAAARPGPDRAVVVGVEESDQHAAILDAATAFALRCKAPLKLVRVTPAPAVAEYPPLGEVTTQVGVDVLRAERDLLQRTADEVRARYPDLPIETSHAEGAVGRILADYARDAGLVVVGSRGRGGFAGLLLGSVSRSLIHHAECPVLVVH